MEKGLLIFYSLKPDALNEQQIQSGLGYVIKDGVASQAMGILTGGAFLTAFAIKLGASNFVIGLLAVDLFAAQPAGLLSVELQQARQKALLGNWTSPTGAGALTLKLGPDNAFTWGRLQGSYTVDGNTLSLTSNTVTVPYGFELGQGGNELTLSGGDLSGPIKFQRRRILEDTTFWGEALSTRSLAVKVRRLVLIVIIVGICRVLLMALHWLFYLLIYCDRGPLKYVFSLHKNRTMTIYSILLNASKNRILLWKERSPSPQPGLVRPNTERMIHGPQQCKIQR